MGGGGGLTDYATAIEAGGGESHGHRKKGVRLGLKKRARRTGGMENKDDGGDGGEKERRGLRRRADKKEARNGVHGG